MKMLGHARDAKTVLQVVLPRLPFSQQVNLLLEAANEMGLVLLHEVGTAGPTADMYIHGTLVQSFTVSEMAPFRQTAQTIACQCGLSSHAIMRATVAKRLMEQFIADNLGAEDGPAT